MAAVSLVFPDYAPDRWARLKTALADHGVDIGAADTGHFKRFGADIDFGYAADTQQLTLVVNHAPLFHSLHGFADQIRNAVNDQK